MKKLLVFLLLTCACALGQTFSGYSGADTFVVPPWRMCMGDDPGAHNACFSQSLSFDKTAYLRGQLDYEFTTINISQLPSASAVYNTGRVYWIKDGQSTADCTQGGGFSFVLCASNGTIWIPIGGGGGGGAPFLLRTNSPTNGTVLNELVEYDNAHLDSNGIATVQLASANSSRVIGICISNCGTTGIATIGTYLSANCISDNPSVVGDLVSASSTPGQCHDYGANISANVQTLGRVSKADTGGGTASLVDFFLGNILAPGSGGGTVTNCASGGGSNAYYANIGTVVSCDPLVTDDGNGNLTAKSYTATDTSHAGYVNIKVGAAAPAPATGFIQHTAPASIANPYTHMDPNVPGTAGQCYQVASTTTDSNGNTIDVMGWGACGGGALAGHTQVATPTAPTLAVGGTPGSQTVCYKIVAWEDTQGAMHSLASSQTCVTTANATLSLSPITLSGYSDTLYGANCNAVYRVSTTTTTPNTTGLIAGCVGKKFVDNGLSGDGTSVPVTNTTDLWPNSASLPGCNVMSDWMVGPDAPPCTPNALDAEFRNTYGAPGDVNNTVFTWGNQQGATAAWTGGELTITTDTLAQAEYLVLNSALPSPPFTFEVYVNILANAPNTAGQECFIGLRESSFGKITTWGFSNISQDSTVTNGGIVWIHRNWTSNSAFSNVKYIPFSEGSGYFKLQDSSGNINAFASHTGDGVVFHQFSTTPVTTAFTTAPNQLVIGAAALAGSAVQCTFDFERRTQ